MALGCTVAELEDRLGVNELREWVVYSYLEPFGEIREDWRLGYLLANIMNLFRKDGSPMLNALDFAPPNVREWANVLSKNGSGDDPSAMPKHSSIVAFEEIAKANGLNVLNSKS